MTWIDYGVIAVLLISIAWGAWRGLVHEVLSLAGWVLAFLAANLLAGPLSESFPANMRPEFRVVGAFLLVFIAVLVATTPNASTADTEKEDAAPAATVDAIPARARSCRSLALRRAATASRSSPSTLSWLTASVTVPLNCPRSSAWRSLDSRSVASSE